MQVGNSLGSFAIHLILFLICLVLFVVGTWARWRLRRKGNFRPAVISTAMVSLGLFGAGWSASSGLDAHLAPDYLIRNIKTEEFNDSIEYLPIDSIDTTEDAEGPLEAFYYSDQPFLLTVDGFNGVLFFPPRPESDGLVGVLPLKQLVLSEPPKFRAHAITYTKIAFIGGRRLDSEANRNPPVRRGARN